MSKYNKRIKDIYGRPIGVVDVYSITDAFECSSALAHAVKKLLMPGARHSKDRRQDLLEAIDSIKRELMEDLDKPTRFDRHYGCVALQAHKASNEEDEIDNLERLAMNIGLPFFMTINETMVNRGEALADAIERATTTISNVAITAHWRD